MTTNPTCEELEDKIKELESDIKEMKEEAEITKKAIHNITLDYFTIGETTGVLENILDNTEIKLSMAETLSIKHVLKFMEVLARKLYNVY